MPNAPCADARPYASPWTAADDYRAFRGLGTVPYRAIKLGRRGASVELNSNYFLDAVAHCEAAAREASMPSLFDLLDQAAAP